MTTEMKRSLRGAVSLLMALIMLAGLLPAVFATGTGVSVGDTITVGSYDQDGNKNNGDEAIEWLVLDLTGEYALVVSKEGLTSRRFHSSLKNCSWADSEVRQWLNTNFYNRAFTKEEQQRISATATGTAGTGSSSYTVYDNVFLLSSAEASRYLATTYARQCKPTKAAIAEKCYISDYGTCWWWLRSAGSSDEKVAYVGVAGNLDKDGNDANWENACVRPAMWIRLEASTTVDIPIFLDGDHPYGYSSGSSSSGSSSTTSGTQSQSSGTIYCWNCGEKIAANSKFCMYCGSAIQQASGSQTAGTTSTQKGNWSSWSTTPAYPSSTREVETRNVIKGYNMVHYGTQMEEEPHYRMFRSYSIQGCFGDYGARDSYGEKQYTKFVTPEQLRSATEYAEGTFINTSYAGYQMGKGTAYNFGDDKYVWFINSTVQTKEYRYRDIY